jgi:hypothetical protein
MPRLLPHGDRPGFLLREPVLFIANALRKADQGHGCLYLACTVHYPGRLNGNPHGSAGDWSRRVDAAGAVILESRAGEIGESTHQLVDGVIRPTVQHSVVSQLRVSRPDGARLPDGAFEDCGALLSWECCHAPLQFIDVEHGDGKGADATARTSITTGQSLQQRGPGPPKPMIGLFKDR